MARALCCAIAFAACIAVSLRCALSAGDTVAEHRRQLADQLWPLLVVLVLEDDRFDDADEAAILDAIGVLLVLDGRVDPALVTPDLVQDMARRMMQNVAAPEVARLTAQLRQDATRREALAGIRGATARALAAVLDR